MCVLCIYKNTQWVHAVHVRNNWLSTSTTHIYFPWRVNRVNNNNNSTFISETVKDWEECVCTMHLYKYQYVKSNCLGIPTTHIYFPLRVNRVNNSNNSAFISETVKDWEECVCPMHLHKHAVCKNQLAQYINHSFLFPLTGKQGKQQQQFGLYIRDGKRLRRMCVFSAFT